MSSTHTRVKIVRRDNCLGDEAVATTKIPAGLPVVDEPPVLVLPHQDVAPTTATAKARGDTESIEALERIISQSPATELLETLQQRCKRLVYDDNNSGSSADEQQEQQRKKQIDSFTSGTEQYAKTALPALQKTEALARKFGLSPGLFAPIVMAHLTMSKAEVTELVSWLISHADLPDGQAPLPPGARQIGFEPLLLTEKELTAAAELFERLDSFLPAPANEVASPTVNWWKNEAFTNNNTAATQQPKQADKQRSILVACLRWLHGVRINVHSDDVNKLTAVFKHACKMNHSCKPNTFWFLSTSVTYNDAAHEDKKRKKEETNFDAEAAVPGVVLPQLRALLKRLIGNAVHIASRDIEKDEPTTFSYIGCGLNLLSPAPQRRHSMSHLHFICACNRCQDYDRAAKPEMLLRALICGECYSVGMHAARSAAKQAQQQSQQQQQPPRPSDFLTLILPPGRPWQCMKCGHEPGYEDLSEAMLHETVHVDMVMNAFFTKSNSSNVGGSNNNNSNIKPLHELWPTLLRAVNQLSPKHYICAVGMASFVSHLVAQLKQKIVSLDDVAKIVQGGAFVSLVTQTMVWFAATMKGTPQHCRFMIAVTKLMEICAASSNSSSGVTSAQRFLKQDEGDAIATLVGGFASSDAYKALCRFPDMHV